MIIIFIVIMIIIITIIIMIILLLCLLLLSLLLFIIIIVYRLEMMWYIMICRINIYIYIWYGWKLILQDKLFQQIQILQIYPKLWQLNVS